MVSRVYEDIESTFHRDTTKLNLYSFPMNHYMKATHFSFLSGYTAHEVIHLLNDEATPLHFSFEEASRHAPGHIASLQIEPMKGVVEPKSK